MSKKNLLINIFISFSSFFVGLTISEIFLSFFNDYQTKMNTKENHIKLELFPPDLKKEVTPTTRYLKQTDSFKKKQRYFLQTDKTGAIVNPEDKNTFYNEERLDILFLGGSTTENMYVKENMRFPAIVSKMINKSNFCEVENCIVLNAGLSGRIIPPSINVLLNRYLIPRPKKVILMHNINDIRYQVEGKKYWESDRHIFTISRYPIFNFSTYTRIIPLFFPRTYSLIFNSYDKFVGLGVNINGENNDIKLLDKLPIEKEYLITKNFKEALNVFVSLCKSLDIEPILMTQASRLDEISLEKKYLYFSPSISYKELGRIHKKFNEIIRGFKSKGLTVIDLDSKIKTNKEIMFDTFHFTEKGNKIAAEIIFNELTNNSKLK
tara:strand:- start:1857 stop:2993 length:1137 start_codon:yes stop_codon:yes gene_type:complete